MKPAVILSVVALAACGAAIPEDERKQALTGQGRAIDGDTVSIDFRLSGADAFERKQLCKLDSGCYPCGKLAQDATARMLRSGDATIRLVGGNSYGRPVAVVSVGGSDLGEQLIAQGWAVPVTKYLKADPGRAANYMAAYEQARTNRLGAHAGEWIEPEKWRRGERLACERTKRYP